MKSRKSFKIQDAATSSKSNLTEDEIKDAEERAKYEKTESEKGDEENEEEKAAIKPVSLFELFRFAEGTELLLIFVGIVAAWGSGLCMPAMTILFGNLSDALVTFGGEQNRNMESCNTSTPSNETTDVTTIMTTVLTASEDLGSDQFMDKDEFMDQISRFGIGLSIIGAVQLVLSYIFVACLNSAAERQIYRIRNLFLESVLRQDIGWYDTHQTGEFASRVSDDLAKFQDGIGEKVGMFNFFCSCFIFSIINAFAHGWQLTLVMLSISPLMAGSIAVLGILQATMAKNEFTAYAVAGAVAEEVLTAIRTVAAFGGEEKEADRYTNNLARARNAGIKRGMITGIGAGILWLTIYGSYALAFWYGVKLIVDEFGDPNPKYDPSNLITVFFSVFMGAITIGRSTPYIEAFSQARAAAAAVYEVIDREPPIDSTSEEGHRPESIIGNIEFNNVHFSYPSRPDVPILMGLNLKVSKGETVALVGESGCGKSTTVQLLQRFYDPHSGVVKLDGRDVRELNLGWLRDHIGIVGQEPILFGTTIAENIRYGRDDATQEEIEKAAKQANAHNFIMKLPRKYDTLVGDRGAQLSGGQKQRVAIARALIKDPKILLLDEATSALDSESEAVVQHALDKAREGRTTIIIAHRLSTIRNADKIAAFSKGHIVELGTHDELMEKKGVYYMLVTTQTGGDKDKTAVIEAGRVPKDEHQNLSMREYARSLSIGSANSVEEITEGAIAFARVPSVRRRKRGEFDPRDELTEEQEKLLKPSMVRLIKENSPEGFYLFMGCIGSLGMGFSTPVFSLIFGDIMGALSYCDPDKITHASIKYSVLFLILGVCTGIFMFLQIFMFAYAGQYLTQRLRRLSFATMLKQEIGWFDNVNNGVGSLCTRLSSDASSVQLATGSTIGNILQSICTLFASTIIGLVLCWQLALVSSCFIPLALIAGYFNGKMIRGQTLLEMVSLDNANKLAIEAISNIRTVASLHKEKKFMQMYKDYLYKPHIEALQMTHTRGLVYGFASSLTYFNYAATMYYGGTLIVNQKSDYETVFKVAELLIMGTQMLSQAFSFAPNFSKGMVAASRIFALLERKSAIDSSEDTGLKLSADTPGEIEFKGAKFHYPTRPDVPVLRNLNLTIKPGQMVALVGSSGCGKSTCIQLLERFYDPAGGLVEMDSHDIKELNIKWLRSRIGIVSQEPILFDCSIAENIAYGDNSRKVEMDEIITSAINANIHNFISALPRGYETSVGDKGAQLSGGQKQRIAIARALLRNPKILLLDEATSALDTESEKVVQEALEKAQKGRTCITVAHRLSTIKDADQIAVIHQGEVVEIGTHDQLIAQKGHYYRFYQTQAKGRDHS